MLVAAFAVLFAASMRFSGSNPDSTASLLMASDIVHGDFFTNDWRVPSDHFLLTDVVFYTPLVLIFGVKSWILPFASAAIILMTIIVTLKLVTLVTKKSPTLLQICLLILLLFPSANIIYDIFRSPAHGATALFALLTLYLVTSYIRTQISSNRLLLLAMIISSAGVFSDMYYMFMAPLPIIIVIGYLYFFTETNAKKHLLILSSQVISIVVAVLGTRLLQNSGVTVVSHVLGFATVEQVMRNIQNLVSVYFYSFGASFFGKLLIPHVLIEVLYISLAVIPIIALTRLRASLKSFGGAYFLLLIVPSMLVLTAVIASTQPIDVFSIRYTLPALILFTPAVLILFSLPLELQRTKVLCVVATLFFFSMTCNLAFQKSRQDAPIKELVATLDSLDLVRGYGTYFSATPTQVYSGRSIWVSPVRKHEHVVQPYYWLSPSAWYDVPANFLVTERGDGEKLLPVFIEKNGMYERKVDTNTYSIYVWPRDISAALERDPNKER